MSRTRVSDNFRENFLRQETQLVAIDLLTLEMQVKDDTTGVITNSVSHYTNQYVPVESFDRFGANVVVYQPAAFKISLGEDVSGEITKTKLDFDAGDRQFIRDVRRSVGTPKVYYQMVMSNTPFIIEIGPVEFQVEAFALKSTSVTADLTVEPVLSEPVPARRYSPTLFPLLWRGEFT